jgi:glutamyl-tRNA reductase
MQALTIIGATYRTTGLDDLGRLLIPRRDLPARLPQLARALGVRSLVYLATCNRVECIVEGPRGTDPRTLRGRIWAALSGAKPKARDAERAFRIWAGTSAVEHLMGVACGLDSARVGDREIASQLRDAWMIAREADRSSPQIDRIIAAALAVAREAAGLGHRSQAGAGFAQRAVERVEAYLDDRDSAVALVGISAMTRAAGRAFARLGRRTLVVNRTALPATALAAELGASSCSWAEFWDGAHDVGAVVSAVGSAQRIADAGRLRKLKAGDARPATLIVDLGVPANIGADVARAAAVPYVDMHELVQEAARERPGALLEAADVRAIVDRHLERALHVDAVRVAGPLIGALRDRYAAGLQADLDELLRRQLGGLGSREVAALRHWGLELARRMAHVPLQGLRSLAESADFEHVEQCVRAMQRSLDGERSPGR